MGTTSNQRKSDQLEMPFGTACARLRQQILFKLVVESGLNVCHTCTQKITSVETLSIEHKEPWFDVNPELFWNLDNIAFSHRSCNRPHRRRGGGHRRPKHVCGTQGGYRFGCRCNKCRLWKSEDNKRWICLDQVIN